jgi:predicted O-methyltransferase YrrM
MLNILLILTASSCAGKFSAYDKINILPLNIWGWFGNAYHLSEQLKKRDCAVVVELGSWLGASTSCMAENIGDNALVYAVDIWEGSPECASALSIGRGMSSSEVEVIFAQLYQQFLSNMIHLNLANKVVPIKMKTIHAAKLLNIRPDLVYVDASHAEEDVYNDIMAWYPKLVDGGIMCGDDWSWETVRAGVIRVAKDLNQTVTAAGNFWWFNPK